jgi:hypothetical protein
LARAFGDTNLNSAGVTSEPEIRRHVRLLSLLLSGLAKGVSACSYHFRLRLPPPSFPALPFCVSCWQAITSSDELVVMGSDGLFDHLTNSQASKPPPSSKSHHWFARC